MTITDHRASSRGEATPFDLSTIEGYEVTSVPTELARVARRWDDLRPGDRILVDWSRRPDKGAIGAVRVPDGVRFIVFDDDAPAEIGRLVNPARLLNAPSGPQP
jgi:hypothetical protein